MPNADFLRPVQMNDLVEAVRVLSWRKKYGNRISWAVVWSDEIRPWFEEKRLDAGERATHPNEVLTWNGPPWQAADDAACDQGLLNKWKRTREKRKGFADEEVGWSLVSDYDEARERAEAEDFIQTR